MSDDGMKNGVARDAGMTNVGLTSADMANDGAASDRLTNAGMANDAWTAFCNDPLGGVHGSHLARALHPLAVADEDRFRRAVSGPRERLMLIGLMQQRLGLTALSGMAPETDDAFMAALDVEAWEQAAVACGVVFWSRILAREVRSSVLRSLDEAFGEHWWRWIAIGPREGTGGVVASSYASSAQRALTWVDQVRESGFALLWAWRDGLDAGLAGWVRLKDADEPALAERANAARALIDPDQARRCVRSVALAYQRFEQEAA